MTAPSRQTATPVVPVTPVRPAHRLPLPHSWSIRPADIVAVLAGNGLLVVAMWLRHGGLDQVGTPAGLATAAGQVTALLGTYLALVQLVLMSRSPWLDQVLGTDRLMVWHRWVGFACLWLLVGHAVLTTLGYALGDGKDIVAETASLLLTYPWVLMATVGLALLVAVAVSSVRAARRRLSYETWFGIHLYAYLGIALAFLHEIVVGTDFVDDQVAVAYWLALYAAAFGLLLTFRLGQPVWFSVRHRLRVANVVREAPGIASIYLTGRQMDGIAVRAGQFFQFRFLSGAGWWRHHPFSISAAPNGRFLRLTVKDLGDDSHRLMSLRPGVRVFAEGPYGAFTGDRIGRASALLIAGGIGITPLRAMLEELPPGRGAVILLYRASTWGEVVFRDELDVLARARGATVRYLVGRRGSPEMLADPLSPKSLSRLVPDVRERDVFVCGSDSFMGRVEHSLRALRVPGRQIHAEHFSY